MSIGLASIILVGIGANFPNPGTYVQVNFAAGPTSASPAGQTVLIIGNKTSAGSAVVDTTVYGPDTPVPSQTESDVIALTGTGSQVHRAWKRFTKVNKTTPVYFVCAAESAGAAATGQLLVTGTASSAGNVRFWYGDDFVDTAVNVNDAATAIGANLATSINNQVNWPITATNVGGAVAITAKNKGPEGNWHKIQVLAGPVFAPAGVAVSVNGSAWAQGAAVTTNTFTVPTAATGFYYKVTNAGSGTIGTVQPSFPTTIGATTAADSNGVVWTCWGTLSSLGIASLGGGSTPDNYTNALNAVVANRFFNILPCDSDATNVGRVVSQVTTQANPTTGIRQRVIFGNVDTSGNAIALAQGLNSPLAEMVWGNATDLTPLEVAANNAGLYSLFEQAGTSGYRIVGRLNFSLFPTANPQFQDQNYWFLQGSRNGPSAGPSVNTVTSLLNNGVTPIALLNSGQAQLVKRVTTRSLNGSTQDWRIRDPHKVAVMFAWADAAQALNQQQFGAKDLLDPPKTGQSPAAGNPPNSFATNVVLWGNALKDLTTKVGAAGLLQNTDVTNASAIVQRELTPRTRMSASFDLVPADIFDQACIVANQVG